MNETDCLMNTCGHADPRPAHPGLAGKAAVALVAILVIGILVGGMFGLYAMHSEDAAFALGDSTPRG